MIPANMPGRKDSRRRRALVQLMTAPSRYNKKGLEEPPEKKLAREATIANTQAKLKDGADMVMTKKRRAGKLAV